MPKVLPRRFRVLVVAVALLTTLFFFFASQTLNSPNAHILAHPFFHYNLSAEEPDDPFQTCVIPRFHPFHPSIWSYLPVNRPIKCADRNPSITYVDERGWLRINSTGLSLSGYTIGSVAGSSFLHRLSCTWRPVRRGRADGTEDDDHVSYGKEMQLDVGGADISAHEYVSVNCQNFAGVSAYSNVHAHVANITASHRPTSKNQSYVNVLVIGIDSMSRQAFMRLLPKTYRFLTDEMSSLVFTGMNKVGDNTFPNLIALLTGLPAYGPDLPDYSQGFDDWPLIWRNYSEAGYVTAWAEDFPDFGLFNYLAKGFRKPPTHHYLRPFWLAVKESPTLRYSSPMCFGTVPKHQLQLEYTKRFVSRYGSKMPYFAFSFLAELSHEYLSPVPSGDPDFERFFRFLLNDGHLNNTFLIIMSDHGHRFDAIRSTRVGRIEERLPFFAIRMPETLTASVDLKHLLKNRGRLITPYDTHATLMDVLHHVNEGTALGTYRTDIGQGLTLFGRIPANRTCEGAGIPIHYCVCEPETPISIDDSKVRASVRVLFNHINNLLRTVREFCSELLPGKVISAQLLDEAGGKDLVEPPSRRHRIRVTVTAQPSNAIFEATLEVVSPKLNGSTRNPRGTTGPYEVRVIGDVSRINKYGDQSSCIRHDILRKYCYCQKPPGRWSSGDVIASWNKF